MKRIHIITATVLILAAAGFAASQSIQGGPSEDTSKAAFAESGEHGRQAGAAAPAEATVQEAAVAAVSSTAATDIPKPSAMSYASTLPLGHIGVHDGRTSDNPEDNLFEVVLGNDIPENCRAWLVYDLYGISSSEGVSKSLNDRPATGGYFSVKTDGWTSVREEIDPSWLNAGVNRIMFTATEGSPAYSVRNLRIETSAGGAGAITLSQAAVSYGGKAYVHGFVRNGAEEVRAGGTPLYANGGEFEGVIPVEGTGLTITAVGSDGKAVSGRFAVTPMEKADFSRAFAASVAKPSAKRFVKGATDSISSGGARLVVDGKTLLKEKRLSVNALRDIDVPALDFGMTNVTAEGEGYRFLPHGEHFTGEGATVKLKYDRTRIPSGYTEDDIRTYYFDNETRHWVALERVAVDKESACVVSRTTHFTDMINGVIQAPESPETEGFAPTMMNDIKAADPTAKINMIAPPAANNRGTASLQYQFEMPPARNGMAPSLGLQYSSEGGSGWLGEGWDVPVPSITVDTRWGVPRYSLDDETETYLLSGSMLSTAGDDGSMGVAHRGEKMGRKADRQFYTRQGGDFSRIVRKGSSPSDYYWEVTQREVISEWKLARVEETHGDYIEYVYETADEDVRGGLKAKAVYLKEVRAGNAGQEPHTVVTFEGSRTKRLKSNNARYGFLTSSGRLLEKVTVKFLGQELRSYAFSYKDGAFSKDLLESVRQYDDNGNEVSFQDFSYYDDVRAEGGYSPFRSESETWNLQDDNLDAGFANPLQGTGRFSDRPTALGGTTSSSTSVSFYAGAGVVDGSPWKGNTVGGSYGHSTDNSKGLSAFVDINGDGLPDKVFRKGGALYYRPQLRGTADRCPE